MWSYHVVIRRVNGRREPKGDDVLVTRPEDLPFNEGFVILEVSVDPRFWEIRKEFGREFADKLKEIYDRVRNIRCFRSMEEVALIAELQGLFRQAKGTES